eukprot:8044097-Ditylum_brightwellii.AAC.1
MKELIKISFLATETDHVGSATGDNFSQTSQLKVMHYQDAMSMDEADECNESVIKDCEIFMKYKVWKAMPRSKVPADANILTSTWAMKPKCKGVKRARLNAQGHEQVEVLSYS